MNMRISPARALPASAADRVELRGHGQERGHAMWSVGSRKLCHPRTEADGKPVTLSNLGFSRARAKSRRSVRLGEMVPGWLRPCITG